MDSRVEVWKVVPSVPRLLASSMGRLMVSLCFTNASLGGFRQYGGVPTKGQWDGARYIYVLKGKTYRAARLVCEAFHGEPFDRAVCMHLNEDSRDNRPENLAWGTQKQNLNAPGFIAYCKSRTGQNNPNVKGKLRAALLATNDGATHG